MVSNRRKVAYSWKLRTCGSHAYNTFHTKTMHISKSTTMPTSKRNDAHFKTSQKTPRCPLENARMHLWPYSQNMQCGTAEERKHCTSSLADSAHNRGENMWMSGRHVDGTKYRFSITWTDNTDGRRLSVHWVHTRSSSSTLSFNFLPSITCFNY